MKTVKQPQITVQFSSEGEDRQRAVRWLRELIEKARRARAAREDKAA